jgi:hypothetical protein
MGLGIGDINRNIDGSSSMILLTDQDGGGDGCQGRYGTIMQEFGAFKEKECRYDGYEKRIVALERASWVMLGIGLVFLTIFGWLQVSMSNTMNKLLEMHLHNEFQSQKEAVVTAPPSLDRQLLACIYNPIRLWRK